MQLTEYVSELERQITIEIPFESFEKEIQIELKNAAQTAKFRGFRPGKVPINMIDRIQGPEIRQRVLNRLINDKFELIAKKEHLRIAGILKLEPKHNTNSQESLIFNVKFEIYPEIKIPDLSTLSLKRYTTTITDEIIEKVLNNLQKQHAVFNPSDSPAENENYVTLDFIESIEETPYANYEKQNFSFVLGQNSVLPELEDAVKGMKINEEKYFSIKNKNENKFSSNSSNEKHIGIKIKNIFKVILPNLDEKFLKNLGMTGITIDELKINIEKNLNRQAKFRLLNHTKKEVMEVLSNAINFEIPKILLKTQFEKKERVNSHIESQKSNENISKNEDLLNTKKKICLSLIISELVKIGNIIVKPDDIFKRIEEFSQDYEKPAQFVNQYLSNQEHRSKLESLLLEENVVDYVLSLANVTEECIPFDKLMGA
ncbi:MAG: trigger factor [Bordetella sp.]|nr:MAG: trigger factor [Bordetella sp.]